jgi:hypothetical protein
VSRAHGKFKILSRFTRLQRRHCGAARDQKKTLQINIQHAARSHQRAPPCVKSHARPHGAAASSNTASRPFALSQVIDIGLDASSKKDGEEKLALLRKNADDISLGLDEIDAELDDESKLEEEGDDDSDDEAGMTPEDKVAKHKAKWQKRAEKYRKYADKGKVDKLQRANEKQTHKLQKVRARALCHQQHQPLDAHARHRVAAPPPPPPLPCRRFRRWWVRPARVQAKDKGKPEAYIAYKQAKCDFTANMIKTAQLVQNLQKSGFL